MAHSIHYGSLLVAAAVAALLAAGEVDGIGFNLHHRSSPVVRRWAEARGHSPDTWWPEAAAESTPEYYSALSRNDRALFARRGLAAGNDQGQGELAFADGNATIQLEGYLHYAEVAVGTPNATFLVALDTGSDLFWVPCGNATSQGGHAYSPSRSSTSKTVSCEHPLCDQPKACALRNSSCPYTVRYVPANASSSGVLVEDVLHLSRENNQHGAGAGAGEAVQAPIVFGCGLEQTAAGAFPGGLMGLGMGKVSVPSLLASGGHVASNSFSMCFGDDGTGRINFGDAGVSPGQAQTPFILTDTPPTYKIATRGMNVENLDVPLEFDAVVDSGASFTYLAKDPYTVFAGELMSKIQDQRANLNAYVPFEYCYGLSPNQTEIYIPDVSFWTKGGGKFPVTRPFFVIDDGNGAVGYCLAILKSETGINVFGQNFMAGLKVVFDREKFVLGWSKFDCYRDVGMEYVESAATAPAPATAPGPARAYGRTI